MIPQEKIKNVDYLFNRIISERIRDSFEPKYCLLLGAGCSVCSNIPSASGVINLLKCICYLREQPVSNDPFIDLKLGKTVDYLQEWFEKHCNDRDFLSFQDRHDELLKQKSRSIFSKQGDTFNYYIKTNSTKGEKEICQIGQNEFLDKILMQLENEPIQDLQYSYWFNQYSSASEDIHSFLSELINGKNPSKSYVFLADLMINNAFSVAFTTNFDNLLAEAITWLGIRSKEIYFDTNSLDFSLSKSVPNVIKLHGDYMYNNTKNLVSETHNLSDPLRTLLNDVLKKCGFIVVGYSGGDNSIMSVFEEASEKYSFPLFWCIREDSLQMEKIHWRAKNLILNSPNAYFVPIKGFEQLIESLWNNYVSYAARRKKREKVLSEIGGMPLGNIFSELYDFERLSYSLGNIKKIIDEINCSATAILKDAQSVPPPNFDQNADK